MRAKFRGSELKHWSLSLSLRLRYRVFLIFCSLSQAECQCALRLPQAVFTASMLGNSENLKGPGVNLLYSRLCTSLCRGSSSSSSHGAVWDASDATVAT